MTYTEMTYKLRGQPIGELASKPVCQWASLLIHTSVRYKQSSPFPFFIGRGVLHGQSETLKSLFFLQARSNFCAVLAKIQVKKQVKSPCFQSFTPFVLLVFKNKTCILHHLAFLEWSPTRIFPSPVTPFQRLKCHFLMGILPFLTIKHMVRRGFIYTISLYVYAYQVAFNCILYCVLYLFTLRLAPKRIAFSIKTHCILRHIALHLAAKRTKVGANGVLFK